MSSQLLIGVLLIGAGILLAVVAYWVVSGAGSSKKPDSADEANEGEELEPAEIASGVPEPLPIDDEDIHGEIPEMPSEDEFSTERDDLEIAGEIAPEQSQAAVHHSGSEVVSPEDEVEKAGKPDLKPQAGPRISIATLLRDDTTGQLIVKVGDTEYQNPEDLRTSSDWTRVEYAASDLQTWISKQAPVQEMGQREPEAVEPKPTSMIEQINAILQEKIDSSGRAHLGVRLLESPSGAARVLIGVQSYDLADVPDEEVRQLIQEAVAIWEADQ